MSTTAAPMLDDRRASMDGPDRWLRVAATALATWSVLYVVPHLYWALGGDVGFSLVRATATRMDDWERINAVASAVLALPVLIGLGLVRYRDHLRIRSALLAATAIGASIAASHGLYGIVYRGLNLLGVVAVDGRMVSASEEPWVVWDLVLFEPWFLVEGVLFVAVGWAAHTSRVSKRRWLVLCATGIALATVSGLVGLKFA